MPDDSGSGQRPLISAVMITRYGQPHWLPVASLRSLLEQAYRPIELVVVSPSCWVLEKVRDWSWDIPVVEVLDEGYSLGRLRRIATEAASGDWVVWWDDDDYSHRQRLSMQLQATAGQGFCYSILARQIRYSFRDNAAIEVASTRFSGTLLARRDALLELLFSDERRGEDWLLYQQLAERFGDVLLDYEGLGCSRSLAACLFIKLFHGENAWKDRDFFLGIRKVPNYWCLDVETASYLKHVLAEKYGVSRQMLDMAYWRSS